MLHRDEKLTTMGMTRNLAFVLLLLTRLVLMEALTFAMVPKRVTSSFFAQADRGCQDAATAFNVTCLYTGPLSPDRVVPEEQAEFIAELIAKWNHRWLGHFRIQ